MTGGGSTSGDPVVAEARAAVSRWTRRWGRRLLVLGIGASVAVVVASLVVDRMSRWRDDLLVTGVRATGMVERVHVVHDKSGRYDEVRIVTTEPPVTFTVATSHGVYTQGERLTVYVDPTNPRHARTDRYVTEEDGWTMVVGVGLLLSVAAVAVALAGGGYLLLVVALARHLHGTEVTARARTRVGRYGHRRILAFADTGEVLWSTATHASAMRVGHCVVGGRRLWRLVWWPTMARPYVLRRPRTPLARWRWRRALDDEGPLR